MNGIVLAVSALLLLVALGVLWKSSRQYRLGRTVEKNGGLDADIDAVRGKPYAFRLKDRIHVVKPLTVERFIEVTSAVGQLGALENKKNTREELMAAYGKLFCEVCPTMTMEIVSDMTHAQVAALYNVVLEILAGKAHLEAEKKTSKSRNVSALSPA